MICLCFSEALGETATGVNRICRYHPIRKKESGIDRRDEGRIAILPR